MEYTYSEETINKVLAYLGARPYAEVRPYVELLMNGTPVRQEEIVPEEATAPTDDVDTNETIVEEKAPVEVIPAE